MFWGMTRKPEVARSLNGKYPNLKLLVTQDETSPKDVLEYEGKKCFGPRKAGVPIPEDDRIITVFPYHFTGRVVNNVEAHAKDCPAVRHELSGCQACGRCWKWS
jgi:hypothetical protein